MTDASSAVIAVTRRDWKTDHLGMYLDSGGAEGHIVDVRKRGPEGNERAQVWASSPARRPIGGQCYHVTKIADCR